MGALSLSGCFCSLLLLAIAAGNSQRLWLISAQAARMGAARSGAPFHTGHSVSTQKTAPHIEEVPEQEGRPGILRTC